MNITITRRLDFCAGHRVFNHEGKCSRLHGHGYVVFIECRGIERETDDIGRVIDFSVIKEQLGGWIDTNWDHRFLMWQSDPLAHYLLDVSRESIVELTLNPTAENLALLLAMEGNRLLNPLAVEIVKVTVHETPNCSAEVSL